MAPQSDHPTLEVSLLEQVTKPRPHLLHIIRKVADTDEKIRLFNEIAALMYEQKSLLLEDTSGEPANKRRRLDGNGGESSTKLDGRSAVALSDQEAVLLEVKDISVSMPQRKKLTLCFTQNHMYARLPGTTKPISTMVYALDKIEYAFCLPVPDKTAPQHNYILFPGSSSLTTKNITPSEEPLVFSVPSAACPKSETIGGNQIGAAKSVSDSYRSLLHWALQKGFERVGNVVKIISADPTKFHSVIPQPQRPKEKAVHVFGYRGSKDGYLFFLENGILWGFKKPLLFIPLTRVIAISYINVLQITFNMVVDVLTGEGEASEELEFSMLDQKDFAGIDAYVKLNRLQDRSMAEQRKARLQLAENRGKMAAEGSERDLGADAGDADGMTELQQAEAEAEQRLIDEEDEEEEDYDPGSDGDSDGSGTSEDEDEEEEDEGEGEGEGQAGEYEDVDGGDDEDEDAGDKDDEIVKTEAVKVEPGPRSVEPPFEMPHRRWAANSTPPMSNNVEMEEETFDVV